MSDKKVLIDIKMIEMGIAPESSSGKKLRKMLDSLPPEEKRKAKRKFRKLWRKITKDDPDMRLSCGSGQEKPNSTHMRNRRAWVRKRIYQEIFQE